MNPLGYVFCQHLRKTNTMEKELTQQTTAGVFVVAPGIWGRRDIFVNYYMIQDIVSGNWVLVDAGLKWSAGQIKDMASALFGKDTKPAAIILTHGHFDHVGALAALLEEWDVPVYAHSSELPYLTGKSAYPPADPTVGGGLMSAVSFLYPTGSTSIPNVRPIPYNETIAELPGWKFIHTPGHSPGHISLFREHDKVLIAGDAIVTTKAESVISTLLQTDELSGPPKYLTCNWASAKLSVLKLTALQPEVVATGHGNVMKGAEMRQQLDFLARHFDEVAVPTQGRYVNEPAVTNEEGVVFLPHKRETVPTALVIMAAGIVGVSLGLLAYHKLKKQFA